MKILLTGFAPFGGETINPSYEAVCRVPDTVAGTQIIKGKIPTSFAACGPVLEQMLQTYRPDAVLCVGQAGGRVSAAVERVAINLMDARIPDNDGAQPIDRPICPDGPAAYFATVPVKAIIQAVRAEGLPCDISYSAGTFVCNCLLYQALHIAATKMPGLRAGFIHLPYSEQQAVGKPEGTPCLPLKTMADILTCAVQAAAHATDSPHESMGTLF